jgi:hypothetical protein
MAKSEFLYSFLFNDENQLNWHAKFDMEAGH